MEVDGALLFFVTDKRNLFLVSKGERKDKFFFSMAVKGKKIIQGERKMETDQ